MADLGFCEDDSGDGKVQIFLVLYYLPLTPYPFSHSLTVELSISSPFLLITCAISEFFSYTYLPYSAVKYTRVTDVTVGSGSVNGITDIRRIIKCLMSFTHASRRGYALFADQRHAWSTPSPSLVKFAPRTPEKRLSKVPHLITHSENVNSSAVDCSFSFSVVQSLNTWHPKCCKSSVQDSKGQDDNVTQPVQKSQNYTKKITRWLLHVAQISYRLWSPDVIDREFVTSAKKIANFKEFSEIKKIRTKIH